MGKRPKKFMNTSKINSLFKNFTPLEIVKLIYEYYEIVKDCLKMDNTGDFLQKRLRRNLSLTGCTDFEKKVYKMVSTIPKGKTRSYEWVARAIGKPRSFRAVGNALNKNPYPGIIPCHRVIRKNGMLGGFAFGISEKNKLLAREGVRI